MATEGIEAVFLETHNWGKAAKFFQEMGYELEFETDHNSGQFRNAVGPSIFIAEIPADREPGTRLVLKVPDTSPPGPGVEVVTPFENTHYGTAEMTVRDPDGRLWSLQAPAQAPSSAAVQAPSPAASSAPAQAASAVPSSAPGQAASAVPSSASAQAASGVPSSASAQAASGAPSSAPVQAPSPAPSSVPARGASADPSQGPFPASFLVDGEGEHRGGR